MLSAFGRVEVSSGTLPSESGARELPIAEVLVPPAILTLIMFAIAVTTTRMAGLSWVGIIPVYFETALAVSVLCVGGFVFLAIANLGLQLAENPIRVVARRLKHRLPLVSLAALIFPLFLASYTAAKCAIPFLVGYGWERFWADADHLIFGADAWRIAHSLFGFVGAHVWELLYSVGWGFLLIGGNVVLTLYASRQKVATFFTAAFLVWLIGGWLMAMSFSAAGPVFAHLFDPTLAGRFEALRHTLASALPPDSPLLRTQAYLAGNVHSRIVSDGAGISAMPSMHIGVMSIFVLAARGTKWIVPAILFWIMIFIGSAYLGYHYWIDGIVAAAVAWVCWKAAELYYRVRSAQLHQLAALPA